MLMSMFTCAHGMLPQRASAAQFALDTAARMNRIVFDGDGLASHPPASQMIQTLTSTDVGNETVSFLIPSFLGCDGTAASSPLPTLCSNFSLEGFLPSDGFILSNTQVLPGDNSPLIQVRPSLCPLLTDRLIICKPDTHGSRRCREVCGGPDHLPDIGPVADEVKLSMMNPCTPRTIMLSLTCF
jgi:hypothetical protein